MNVLNSGSTVFDSSAIKLPDLGGVMTSLPGKFTTNSTPRDESPAVTASQPIGQSPVQPSLDQFNLANLPAGAYIIISCHVKSILTKAFTSNLWPQLTLDFGYVSNNHS